jgi:hypothetical protein
VLRKYERGDGRREVVKRKRGEERSEQSGPRRKENEGSV